MSVKAPHCAAWLWFSGVIYHWELSNSNTGPISGWTDSDYYKWRSTLCCFCWTQSPLCRWFDTHFSASTFISSSGCCCLGGIEGQNTAVLLLGTLGWNGYTTCIPTTTTTRLDRWMAVSWVQFYQLDIHFYCCLLWSRQLGVWNRIKKACYELCCTSHNTIT